MKILLSIIASLFLGFFLITTQADASLGTRIDDINCSSNGGSCYDMSPPNCPSGSSWMSASICRKIYQNQAAGFVSCCTSSAGSGGLTCNGITGGFCNNPGHNCSAGFTFANASYECQDTCCRPLNCADIGGTCAQIGHFCPNGKTADYNNDSSCYNGDGLCCQPIQNCNGGGLACGACYISSNQPANHCGNVPQAQNCSYTTYAGSSTCYQNYNIVQGCANTFQNNCNAGAGYSCINNNTCVTNIFVHVYTDYNHDGAVNGNDAGKPGVTITDNGGNFPQTDGSGTVTFSQKAVGTYTITMTVPAGYQAVGPTSQQAQLTDNAGNVTLNFYLTPLYAISGTTYNDLNETYHYEAGYDSPHGNLTVTNTTSNTSTSTNGSGVYSFTNLLSGQYAMQVTLPAGYKMSYPSTGQFIVTVGTPGTNPACSTSGYNDAACDGAGNITGLDFGITNSSPGDVIACADVREDSGITANVASTYNCSGTVTPDYIQTSSNTCPVIANTAPGIAVSGNVDPVITGGGNISSTNWQVGDATYPELFTPRIQGAITTSYEFISSTIKDSGLTTTPLNTLCNINACDLSNIPNGIYTYTGDVTTVASHLTTHKIILLINGNLTIGGTLLVDPGAVDVIATTGNITVSGSVGEPSISSTTGDVEGLFTTDQSFIIASNYASGQHCNLDGTSKDLKLNLQGSIIANAKSVNVGGGSFVNNRTLCADNLTCPVDTITARPDMLLFLPTLVKNTNNIFQETAPGAGD